MKPSHKFILNQILFLFITLLIGSKYTASAQCSEFYGMTSLGGEFNKGMVYKVDEKGNYTVIHSFEDMPQGKNACGDLCEALNGKFYGMTSQGGAKDQGILFEWDPDSNLFIKRLDFDSALTGSVPKGSLIFADNGYLYGMTSQGGKYGMGTIFEWNPRTNIFSKKLDFSGIETGSHPNGSLLQANTGYFYGMTLDGGLYNMGVIFEWDPENNSLIKKVDFDGNISGKYPYGSLIQADNGMLYGMTSEGGANNDGVLFDFDRGINLFTVKIDFSGADKGKNPHGSLLQAKNGKLYGMTVNGGLDDDGVIFEYDPSTADFQKKIDFSLSSRGHFPYGSLVLADNGKMYGMTRAGGKKSFTSAYPPDTDGPGVLFEWDPATNIFIMRYDFGMDNDSHSGLPFGSLIRAKNGKIYGMTSSNVFEWNFISNTYSEKIDLNLTRKFEQFGCLLKSRNGKIYGLYSDGGFTENGAFFEIDQVTNKYEIKINFSGEDGSFNSIISESGYLMEAQNGKIYGTTPRGGSHDNGVIFEWDPSTASFTKKLEFDDFRANPIRLLQTQTGKFYVTASGGGGSGYGILYEWDPVTNLYIKRLDFSPERGSFVGPLIEASNGKIYGTTLYDGKYGYGVLFEWDPESNLYTRKFDFKAFPWGNPHSVVEGDNGKFYILGSMIMEWDPATDNLNMEYAFFDYSNGIYPGNTMIKAFNGRLYGVTKEGGRGSGVVYEFDVITKKYKKLIDFGYGTAYGLKPISDLTETVNPNCNKIMACDSLVSPSGRYTWKTSGVYQDTIPGSDGKDSILFFNLIVEKTRSIVEWTVCDSLVSPSGHFIWKTDGVYYDTLKNSGACNKILTVKLKVMHKTFSKIDVPACETYISPSGKNIWTSSGVYTDTVPNKAGCDSIITINLMIRKKTYNTIYPKACSQYISPSGKYIWAETGTYTDIIPNAAGCDSVITIFLEIANTHSHIDVTACESYTSANGRYTWTHTGIYTDTIPNSSGCDSIITIHLIVKQINTNVIQDGYGLQAAFSTGSYQWINCLNGAILPGETNQSFTARDPGNYAVIISDKQCLDTSNCFTILPTSFEDKSNHKIIVYPNPASGSFTLDLGQMYAKTQIKISNPEGRKIFQEKFFNTDKIKISEALPPGLYIISVNTGDRDVVLKIVTKEK